MRLMNCYFGTDGCATFLDYDSFGGFLARFPIILKRSRKKRQDIQLTL